jgi:uncharacterized protein (UPF0335 family)
MDRDLLKSFIERVQALEEEKASLSQDVRDILTEAKAKGLDPKTITAVVRLLKQEKDERESRLAKIEEYLTAYEGAAP